ncbi:MAG: YpdA family putative bacillithiol disulfide reductase [Firmicutes bacterium]|nr:YpdA family putative bacillithiol disulfide reductase [Bacillota bacterium]
MHEVAIIGAGPCGLAAALAAHRAGLDYVVVEQGSIAHSITRYPVFMTFFSTADRLEIGGIPLISQSPRPSRTEALTYYRRIAENFGLRVRQWEKVVGAERLPEGFRLRTQHRDGRPDQVEARNLVVATGYFDSPNLLGVPGEDDPNLCSHHYTEPGPYYGLRVVVVGGGNSAVEAALDLYRHGARPVLVHRGPDLSEKVKPWIVPEIRARLADGSIPAHFNTVVRKIEPGAVTLQRDETVWQEPCDFVFALTGYRPDHSLIRSLGVAIDPETGVPQHNPETMETNVPGLFLAGVVAAGYDANKIFIENGREHGERIVRCLLARRQ